MFKRMKDEEEEEKQMRRRDYEIKDTKRFKCVKITQVVQQQPELHQVLRLMMVLDIKAEMRLRTIVMENIKPAEIITVSEH